MRLGRLLNARRSPLRFHTPEKSEPVLFPRRFDFPGTLSLIVIGLFVIIIAVAGCDQSMAPSDQDAARQDAASTRDGETSPPVGEAPSGPQTAPRPGSPGASPSQTATTRKDTITEESWTSFRNSPQQLGVARTTLPDDLELLWEHAAPDGVTGAAAIAGGRVYVGVVGGFVYCLDLHTGEEIWSYRSIDSDDPKEFAPGFQAPVTVTEELVLCGDEDGLLHAVDRATGRQRWKFNSYGEVVGGATVIGEHVLFGSHGGRLFKLNLADGSTVWEFDTRGPVNGSQAVSGRYTFVTGCDQPILRVVDIETGQQHSEVPLEGLLIATPALVDDVLYFGTSEGIVFALDWKARQTVWQYADPNRKFEIHSSPAVVDDLVLIGSRDKRLHAINRITGEGVWTFATRAGIDSSPVVVDDRVYFGSRDKNLYGLSLADGTQIWKYSAGQAISGSPAIGEGHLVIGTDETNGRILCFGAK